MSRVVYTEFSVTPEQEALRQQHQVRLVEGNEEGSGVNILPNGVFGFTYSPALPNAPLFATRRYRAYETHKTSAGEVFVVGFATPEEADPAACGGGVHGAGDGAVLTHPAASPVCGAKPERVHRDGQSADDAERLIRH